ncbi:MAG: amidohydrolase family protein [Deltaproteobacteria bacterium]|nr:amidohydrolase family protein [Deltaproteobacteria bacterium]
MTAIDVHAHFVPPKALEALSARGVELGVSLVDKGAGAQCCRFDDGLEVRPFLPGLLDLDGRLAEMDGQRVARQILSVWTDIFGYGLDAARCDTWHRILNDGIAELCGARPERFAWMASAPLVDAAVAARELERCAANGAVGVIVTANVDGRNLGEAPLDEFWSACEALDMPVFVHPSLPQPLPRAERFSLNQTCAYTMDTTLAVGSMILSGTLDRFPGLRLLLAHGGGNLLYLIGRFDRMHDAANRSATGDKAAHPPSAYVQRFLYDSIVHSGDALRFLREMVGIERILLGGDAPFPPGDPDPVGGLEKAGLDDDAIERIAVTNPMREYRLG